MVVSYLGCSKMHLTLYSLELGILNVLLNIVGNHVSIWRQQLVLCLGIGILKLVLQDWQLYINL